MQSRAAGGLLVRASHVAKTLRFGCAYTSAAPLLSSAPSRSKASCAYSLLACASSVALTARLLGGRRGRARHFARQRCTLARMATVNDILLKPVQTIAYRRSLDLKSVAESGRNVFLVGKKEFLCKVAKDFAAACGQQLIAKQAEALSAGYKGSKVEVPWLCGDDLRKVNLVALPDAAGRHVTPVRPEIIAKQLHGKTAGQEVVLAVGQEDALAAGLAVARTLSPYTAKADKPAPEPSVCNVSFYGCEPNEEIFKNLEFCAEGIRVAQGLTDMPPNVMQPTSFKELVLEAVKDVDGVTCEVIEGEQLQEKGYGLIYAVGKCSIHPPRLIVLTHKGKGAAADEKGVALVGKGITFDTGGAALKSRDGMIGMKRDMGGAAGMFGAFLALAKNGGLPSGRPLHCVLCIAENAIGSKAFVQDDIIKAYSGLTVEINNTDAEGRLVLSDGVAHVAKHLNCDTVMDMATLTGAQGISTGSNHGLILATDEEFEREVIAAGKFSGDMVHPGLFAPELLMHEFDSEFADLRNSVKNRSNAQSSCAGLFIHRHLTHCSYKDRWLHIDMAYPVHDPLGDYATGWGVGLLTTYLSSEKLVAAPSGSDSTKPAPSSAL